MSFARNASSHKNIRRNRQIMPIATANHVKPCVTRVKQLKNVPLSRRGLIRLDYPCSRELDKGMPHSSFSRGMSRTFNVENEYTRCTCSPGGGCRLGSVQLGVLISGYFIPPPFPLRSPLIALPLSRFSSPNQPTSLVLFALRPSRSRRRACLFLPCLL